MTLPTFLVIGAMKSGTTTLYDHLARHPEVFMARPKELHYFTAGMNWDRGRRWYEERFAGSEHHAARGEVSPSYSQADIFPGVPGRIHDLLPDVRLAYIVRHPIRRIQSMYLHQVANGRETLPIERAVREHRYYVNASRYAWQLDQHLEFVPPERIKVVTTESLGDHRDRTLADVLTFLGVDPARTSFPAVQRGRTEDKRVARRGKAVLARVPGYRRLKAVAPTPVRRLVQRATTTPIDTARADLPPSLEAELAAELRDDVARLTAFLGPSFDGWGLLEP